MPAPRAQSRQPRLVPHWHLGYRRFMQRGSAALALMALALGLPGPAHAASAATPPPQIAGPYVPERSALLALGFTPLPVAAVDRAAVCSDEGCTTIVKLPEGQCTVGTTACAFFWRARDGRFLRIDTLGLGYVAVDSVSWVSAAQLPPAKP